MHEVTEATLLKRARDASAQGDWQQAHHLLVELDASQRLHGPDLALLADCAYAAGHVDLTIDTWERLHAEALREGDRLMAAGAAIRVALHLLFDTWLRIRGWATRAERLRVTDNLGATARAEATVTVSAPPSQATSITRVQESDARIIHKPFPWGKSVDGRAMEGGFIANQTPGSTLSLAFNGRGVTLYKAVGFLRSSGHGSRRNGRRRFRPPRPNGPDSRSRGPARGLQPKRF